MAKTVGTTHNVLKVFGIKIYDYYSDYVCNETIENVETMRDDIILHEKIIRAREHKMDSWYLMPNLLLFSYDLFCHKYGLVWK